jgi:hypothetical protein
MGKVFDMVGKMNKLNGYFGLSYAGWLTIPRVMLQEMPEEWQNKFVDLLDQYDKTFSSQPAIETEVSCKVKGKYIKQPAWLDYRHTDHETINAMRGQKQ